MIPDGRVAPAFEETRTVDSHGPDLLSWWTVWDFVAIVTLLGIVQGLSWGCS